MSSAPAFVSSNSIVLAATFTAEPLATPLAAWMRWLETPAKIRFAPYNQVFQQLLDPHSLVASHAADTVVFLVRLSDWSSSTDLQAVARLAQEFAHALESWAASIAGQVIVVGCPSAAASGDSRGEAYLEIEAAMLESLAAKGVVHTISSGEVEALYPVTKIDDELADRAGHIPYTQAYYTALATFLTRRWVALQRRPTKAIALDCDNTLWTGVCGELGPRGIELSAQRLEFQRQLLQLREAGLLLCLCSKNNPSDAWEVFDRNPSMLLQRHHITAAQLNWRPKSENLRELAQELNLGLDSLVFIDDSPVEIAEVRAHLPEVLSLQLPAEQAVPLFARHIWAFDRWRVTAEDRQRAESYTREIQRTQARQQSPSLEQFLNELDLRVEFVGLDEEHLERAAQLTERTNQFNLSTRRRSVNELRELCTRPTHAAFLVRASDKFGDYGLVGLVIYEVSSERWRVDTFLLSCRALGRRIESQMLLELGRRARARGVQQLELLLIPSDRNQPAREFVERLVPADVTDLSGQPASQTHVIDVAQLESLLQRISRSPEVSDVRSPTRLQPSSLPQSSEIFEYIATELNSVEAILGKLRSEALPRPELEEPFVEPRSLVEQYVAAICQEILNRDRIGLADRLKDLGASSLHIVQIYSRLVQELSARISITDLFALPTVRDIVAKIEAAPEQANLTGRVMQPPSVSSRSNMSTGSASPSDFQSHRTGHNIAVVGMAGRFPGASNVREFWENVTQGVCSIVDIPDDQLNLPPASPLRNNPNLVRRGATVQDADKFDARFFGIFPKEATLMDPQHRLFLESCWHAIEDAGYNVEHLQTPVGVFAGCYMDTYMLASLALSPQWLESLANAFHGGDLLTELGNDKDYLATRVSFLLNLRGPAITVQTACSTSLVAIAQACQSLASGQCGMALAGGATLKLPQNRGYLYTEGGMVSPDGMCRTFDARARGTVFGEGCGVVLLKRVEDALADGDDIYAVIKGWGLNNDGRAKLGYTAPSVEGQAGAIQMAQHMAAVSAETITLVEAHGTGTSLGDPIEIESLTRVFRHTSSLKQYCAIGSVKTNIGHLDVAAGVTGLIKTSLALKNRVIPPSLHFEQPNPNIDFANSPFYVNTTLQPWNAPFPRRAGLSSFGVGGTNAHVVLEEAPELRPTSHITAPQLLTLSARSPAALDQQRFGLMDHLKRNPQTELADVAYTLQTGRKTFNYSLVTVAHDVAQAIQVLTDNQPQQVHTARQLRRGKSVVFMFPGQGSQHWNMAGDLYAQDDLFRAQVDHCAQLLTPHLGFDLRQKIFEVTGAVESHELNQTEVAQASIFTVSYALAKCWEARGITAGKMLGHSVGEFVAACLAGVFTLEDALRLVAYRARCMQRLPRGSMLAVRLSEADLLKRLPPNLSIAAVNGPLLCVISGPTPQVESLRLELQADEIVCRSLHTSHAFHSAMMDPVVELLAEQLKQIELQPPRIPIISSVTGQLLSAEAATDPWYWARHLRETVRFTDVLSLAAKDSDDVLLEVGPGQTLSTLARQHPQRDAEQGVVSTLPHAKQRLSSREYFLLALGRLWQSGVEIDWTLQFATQHRRRVHLPGYPFERQRYWLEPDAAESLPSSASGDDAANEDRANENAAYGNRAQDNPVEPNSEQLTARSVDAPTSSPLDSAADVSPQSELDALTQRVIQQQLMLMKQQLDAWGR
jgi:phthiocerol/phenolphthiocerol synthesis type-I polyketide synthase E